MMNTDKSLSQIEKCDNPNAVKTNFTKSLCYCCDKVLKMASLTKCKSFSKEIRIDLLHDFLDKNTHTIKEIIVPSVNELLGKH